MRACMKVKVKELSWLGVLRTSMKVRAGKLGQWCHGLGVARNAPSQCFEVAH